MALANPTWNQHYITQAEQRLNAIDRSKPKDRQRIWAFRVDDHDSHALAVPTKERIKYSLSLEDLFSLHVFDERQRANLESLFEQYERKITSDSQRLIDKLRTNQSRLNIRSELRSIFTSKLLNFARNPNGIVKALNTFGAVTDHKFGDPEMQREFAELCAGSRPQRDTVCATFGVSPDAYDRWLQMLYMLLIETRTDAGPFSLFRDVVAGMFGNNFVTVFVFEYTDDNPEHVCLLSDRGLNSYEAPLGQGFAAIFEFNLNAKTFACFSFADPTLYSERLPASTIAAASGQLIVTRVIDDISCLVKYNQRTMSHCASMVFGATPSPKTS